MVISRYIFNLNYVKLSWSQACLSVHYAKCIQKYKQNIEFIFILHHLKVWNLKSECHSRDKETVCPSLITFGRVCVFVCKSDKDTWLFSSCLGPGVFGGPGWWVRGSNK